MSIKNINDSFILNEFNNENNILSNIESNFNNTKKALLNRFPTLTDADCISIIDIMRNISSDKEKESCELIVTSPNSFKLETKTTFAQIDKLINNAKKQIIMTGYSVSNYFDDFIDAIINKSQKGVLVQLYLNKYENTVLESKLSIYLGKFLKIYTFSKNADKMAALHAKIISVDGCKSLISSANLSYHGLEKNIEIGCVIESKKVANNIKKLLEQLYFQKVFIEIKKQK